MAADQRQSTNPYTVIDFQNTYWLANPAACALQPEGRPVTQEIIRDRNNVFDLLFDSDFIGHPNIENGTEFFRDQIFYFQRVNRYRRHLPFYQKYPQVMQAWLTREDYKTFEHLWETVTHELDNPAVGLSTNPQGQRTIIALFLAADEPPYKFVLSTENPLYGSEVLQIVKWEPLDELENGEHCRALFGQYEHTDETCVTLWDELGEAAVEAILASWRLEKAIHPKQRDKRSSP